MTEHPKREPFRAPQWWWSESIPGYFERFVKAFEDWANQNFTQQVLPTLAHGEPFCEGTTLVCDLPGGALYCEHMPDGRRRYWAHEATHTAVVWDTALTSVPTLLAALLHEEQFKREGAGA